MLAESPDPTKLAEEILKATEDALEARTQKDSCKIREKCRTCFEFCCPKNSSLGEVNMDRGNRGINHFRLSRDQTDMSSDVEVDWLDQHNECTGQTCMVPYRVVLGLVGKG